MRKDKLMKDFFKLGDPLIDTIWESKKSEIDMEVACPECLKHIGCEGRFILPLLPKKIRCPYCNHEFTVITKKGT
jgi:hypothetical protein